MAEKIRVYKLSTADDPNNWCAFRHQFGLGEEISTFDVGEILYVEIVEMTQEEYDNLPEFEGF